MTQIIKTTRKKIDKKIRHIVRRQKIWLKHLPQPEKKFQYIFHHIPKCAGTSAVDALSNWFIVVKDYPPGWSDRNNSKVYEKFCSSPKKINKLKDYHLLAGHYHVKNSFLHQRYPIFLEDRHYRIFTFLREPLELQISLYYYEIRNKIIPSDESLEKRLLLRKNYIAAIIPCDEFNYKEKLDYYFFIGLVEKYQESFDKLAELLDKPKLKLKTYNESLRTKRKLSQNFISQFKELNQLDYQVYNYAKKKYENIV